MQLPNASTVAGDCSTDLGLQSSEDFRGRPTPWRVRDSQPGTDRFVEPVNRETLNDEGVTVCVVCLLTKLTSSAEGADSRTDRTNLRQKLVNS